MSDPGENGIDLDDVLSSWPLAGPRTVQAVGGGNNLTYIVSTPAGRYVLRSYRNTADVARMQYEHAILARLARSGLSFAAPAPTPTRLTTTSVAIAGASGRRLAALFPFIAGQHPAGNDSAPDRVYGAALAELDHALSRLDIAAPRGVFPPFGRLSDIHPSIPDPLEMLEYLPLKQDQRSRITGIFTALLATVPRLYGALPRQIVHRNFDASNILMEGERVSGVLDFEFAGPDARAVDLARSTSLFAVSPWSHPEGWQRVAAFAGAYREHLELTPGEIDAIPDLMRLYRAMSLVHRAGRRRQGLARASDVRARAAALLRQEEWLQEKHAQLRRVLSGRAQAI